MIITFFAIIKLTKYVYKDANALTMDYHVDIELITPECEMGRQERIKNKTGGDNVINFNKEEWEIIPPIQTESDIDFCRER